MILDRDKGYQFSVNCPCPEFERVAAVLDAMGTVKLWGSAEGHYSLFLLSEGPTIRSYKGEWSDVIPDDDAAAGLFELMGLDTPKEIG